MKAWNWMKNKITRNHHLETDPSKKEFQKMLRVEREAAERAQGEANRKETQAKELRDKSWYLHGRFERAKTTDPFSEWLFSDEPEGRTR